MLTLFGDLKAGGDGPRRNQYLQHVGHMEDIRRGLNNANLILRQQNFETIQDIIRLTGGIVALRRDVRETNQRVTAERTRQKFSALPFKEVEDVCDFDLRLYEKEELVDDFKKWILKSVGFDTPSFLRAALRKVFTDNLATKLRWKGTRNHTTAERCYCIKLIKDVCCKKYGAEESFMNIVLQEFFVHAKERLSNRLKVFNNNVILN